MPDAIKPFDWKRLRSESDKFPHLRLIGSPGVGKTTLADWLLDVLGCERFVITPKKKPDNWKGITVYGVSPTGEMFQYEAIRTQLEWVHQEMHRRYQSLGRGSQPQLINFVVDEWRLINKHVGSIKDPETKEISRPAAKDLMKDIITVAREAQLRMIALAQGEQVETWGFDGESDLEECFTTIRIGHFAVEHAQSLRAKCRKGSADYDYWSKLVTHLDALERPCMIENQVAVIPDLSNWRRVGDEKSLMPSNALGEPLRTIWCFCKKQGDWVATRDVLRQGFSTLKDVNTEKLREYFFILKNTGYGETDESGGALKIRIF